MLTNLSKSRIVKEIKSKSSKDNVKRMSHSLNGKLFPDQWSLKKYLGISTKLRHREMMITSLVRTSEVWIKLIVMYVRKKLYRI